MLILANLQNWIFDLAITFNFFWWPFQLSTKTTPEKEVSCTQIVCVYNGTVNSYTACGIVPELIFEMKQTYPPRIKPSQVAV